METDVIAVWMHLQTQEREEDNNNEAEEEEQQQTKKDHQAIFSLAAFFISYSSWVDKIQGRDREVHACAGNREEDEDRLTQKDPRNRDTTRCESEEERNEGIVYTFSILLLSHSLLFPVTMIPNLFPAFKTISLSFTPSLFLSICRSDE